MEKRISFLNEFGDSLIFDGWVVREVSGLSINRANWKVQDRQASRRYLSGSRLFAEHLCDSWQSNIRLKMTRYTQKCEGFSSYENSIIVDKEGHIILIRQAVGSNTYLKLTKNKSTI